MNTKRLVFLSILISQAIILGYIERFIPFPFLAPGAKIGLANVVALVCLYRYGFKEALLVQVLRVLLISLLFGNMASFLFSLSGAIFSTTAMSICHKLFKDKFSIMGISLIGAIFHHIGQLSIAAITIQTITIFSYAPILFLISIPTGIFIGILAKLMLSSISRTPWSNASKY